MRYVPHTDVERAQMLDAVGVDTVGRLFDDIPAKARLNRPLHLPPPLTEMELTRHLQEAAAGDRSVVELTSYLGCGYYDRFIPQAVAALISRGEFLTAYTPYQPELSQGTLAGIFEFQTMVAELTGMDAAQASMYDGASAVAEAALMAMAHTGRSRVAVSSAILPDSLTVLKTYLAARGGTTVMVDDPAELDGVADAAAVIWQYPDLFGRITDLERVVEPAHAKGALAVVAADPVALAVLRPPGEFGADVVVGEGQPLGNRMQLGGPTFGYFAVRSDLVRRLPGRLVGETRDMNGRRGFVLTLQAREQHIRRDKATSNICSNHSLCALTAAVYLSLMGPKGLNEAATLSAHKARYLAQALSRRGLPLAFADAPYLYEFTLKVPGSVADLNRYLLRRGILGGFDLGRVDRRWRGLWQIAVTEKRTRPELDRLVEEVSRWMSR